MKEDCDALRWISDADLVRRYTEAIDDFELAWQAASVESVERACERKAVILRELRRRRDTLRSKSA